MIPGDRPAADDFDVWIEAGHTEKNYWADLWRYRELFFILAWRDVAVRYKQTVAGVTWAVLQPVLSISILTLIFGKVAGLPSEGNAPYVLMVVAGILPWQFFANALASGSQSIVAHAGLISKVYFPRLIIPSSSIVVSLIDFVISCSILAVLMIWYQMWPSWRLLTLPFLLVLAILAALGPALLITALSVRYRDFRFLIPLIIQFGLFISPVAYSSSIVRDKLGETWFLLYSMNPMVGVIDAFRWAILGQATVVDGPAFGVSILLSAVLCIVGIAYFRRMERKFADII